jgi:hypothetical protein
MVYGGLYFLSVFGLLFAGLLAGILLYRRSSPG